MLQSSRSLSSILIMTVLRPHHPLQLQASAHAGAGAGAGLEINNVKEAHSSFEGTKQRIQKLLSNVQLSVSSYDTAWVAMIPSPISPKAPCFPECLNWLMDNQFSDGSWGIPLPLPHPHPHPHPPLLLKDTLSSTLASIVALKRWSVGEDQINKGLQFIDSNLASATHRNLHSPIGFDIIFPHMLELAKDLNLKLPLEPAELNVMLNTRDLELTRRQSHKDAYLAYVAEGLGSLFDWKMVMKYQMKNGSLFNSPSATAAAFIHHQDAGCLNYLTSLLKKFGSAVPTVYPFHLYLQLCMVDNLERLGIARHFRVEIQNVLDEAYRCWMQDDEQIFMDVTTCALTFRVLRANGYDVSSDPLARISNDRLHKNSDGNFEDVYAALEVYRASQLVYHDELAFREQSSDLRDFLKQTLANTSTSRDRLTKFLHLEVDNTLNFPFNSSLERMSSRRNIERYNVDNVRVLKSSACSSNISNEDYLRLAVEDFNACQSIFRGEVEYLESWVVEKGLDKLQFARQKTAYCYFSAASTISSPELSDARISWAKSGILTTVIDDFFDVGGTMEELVNLIHLVDKWNVDADNDCCSEDVRIIFLALKDAISWIGNRAFKWQSRSVTSHVIETWLSLMKSMLKEAAWSRDNQVPSLNEYMENGYVSFALGPIVLPALYLVGPKLSVEMVQSSEYHNLFELMSTYGRLKNDIQGFKREVKEGKVNAVTLHMSDGNGGGTEEEAVEEMKVLIERQKRQLLRLVLQEKGSIVPRACKDLFWNMCSVLNLFYATDDGFTENGILDVVKAIIYEPVSGPADAS